MRLLSSKHLVVSHWKQQALTPNMLPLIVNTSLAKGAVSMAKDRCIVKSLAAIREMGSMDILCMDKTGTLTMNHAIVIHHLDAWGLQTEKVLHFAFLNSYFKTDQKYPLDEAILAFAYTNGYRFQPSEWRKVDEIPFDYIRRRVAIILQETGPDGRSYSRLGTAKGALEHVTKVCSFVENFPSMRKVKPFSSEDNARIMSMEDELNNQTLRILGIVVKRLDKGDLSLSTVE
ncbi:unnamed protein product [Linum trigynum]|uniref:Uncharacterized protein n=1 Tax=Linum trigynum TaxID=586398 RepID=A0AAV2DVC3_9ROSI